MATSRQKHANQKNALKSTGPRTARGKQVVSKNAVQHGLTAQQVLVPGESEDEFEALVQKLITEFQPEGEFELQLVERIATCIWRQRRIYRIESEIMRAQYLDAEIERLRDMADLYTTDRGDPFVKRVVLSSEADMEERARLLSERDDVRMVKAQSDVSLGKAFARGGALNRLFRYETIIERALYKAHHELLRLQAQRRGEGGAVPLAIDVQMDGSD